MSVKDKSDQDYEIALARIQQVQTEQSSQLTLKDLSFTVLPPEIKTLANLESLDLSGCTELQDFSLLTHLSHLKNLELGFKKISYNRYYLQLTDLRFLPALKILQTLDLTGCKQLSDLSPLSELSVLQQLRISSDQLSDLSPLSGLSALQELDLMGCQQLSNLLPLSRLSALQQLNLSSCYQLSDLSPLSSLSALQQLNLSNCDQLSDLSPLSGLNALQQLYLSSCDQLSDLSPLSGLNALQELYLSSCDQLSDLSPLSRLRALQRLSISSDQLSDLLPLSELGALQRLSISSDQLSNLLPLSGLSALQHLDLRECDQLSDLSPLSGLSALQKLNLSRCDQLNDLSPLSGLNALQQLDLSSCDQLSDLSGLRALQELNLSYCDELRDLLPLSGLSALQQLDLSHCEQLSDLSPLSGLRMLQELNLDDTPAPLDCLPNKAPLSTWQSLETLYCNHLLSAPSELGSTDYGDNCIPRIRHWQHDLQQGEASASITKVIIIGNGRVGKTQLCRRLQGLDFDASIPSTHGIDLQQCSLRAAQDGQAAVEARLWDFGGQDIYLGTHSLFLDERAIYVLAWHPDSESGETFEENGVQMRNRPLSYWLAFIESAAGKAAPIILAQTQCDTSRQEKTPLIPSDVNFDWLRSVHTSAINKDGIDELKAVLQSAAKRQLEQYKKVRLPQSWVNVDKALRVDDSIRTVAYQSFLKLCEQHRVSAPDAVLEYLHRSGQVFWTRGVFDEQVVLDLSWAFQGLYALHHRELSLPYLKQDDGKFRASDLNLRIWRSYSDNERQLFLSLMQECHMCFELKPHNDEEKTDSLYLAPEFLPTFEQSKNRVKQFWRSEQYDIEVRLHYTFIHEGLLRTALSKLGAHTGEYGAYWAYGLCFYDDQHNTEVLIDSVLPSVESGNTQGYIVLKLQGGQAKELVEKLIKIITQDSPFKADIAWLKEPEHNTVLDDEALSDELTENMVLSPAKPPSLPNSKIPVYISYTWRKEDDQSEDIVDAFYAALPQEHFILMQDKKTLEPGQWISCFMRDDIGRGDYVLVVISERSLKSTYCMQELLHLMQYSQQNKVRFLQSVIPIVVGQLDISSRISKAKYALYWKKEMKEMDGLLQSSDMKITDLGGELCNDYIKMEEFQKHTYTILTWLSDVVMPRGFDGLEAAIDILMERAGVSVETES